MNVIETSCPIVEKSNEELVMILAEFDSRLGELIKQGTEHGLACSMVNAAVPGLALQASEAMREIGRRRERDGHEVGPLTRAEGDLPTAELEAMRNEINAEHVRLRALGYTETTAWHRQKILQPGCYTRWQQCNLIISQRQPQPMPEPPPEPAALELKKSEMVPQSGSFHAISSKMRIRFAKPYTNPPCVVVSGGDYCSVTDVTCESFVVHAQRAGHYFTWIALPETQTSECETL